MPLDKIELPECAGDDWVAKEKFKEENEQMIIVAIKKINAIIDEVNK